MGILFGGSSSRVNKPKPATTIRINTSLYGVPRTILLGGQQRIGWNLIWYGDFAAKAQSQGGKGGVLGGGKAGGKGAKTYTYSAAVIGAICEGPVQSVGTVWNTDGTQTTLAKLNLTAFTGSYSQSAWSYLTSKHPTQADTYRGTCFCAAGPMQLGDSPALPNLTFEVTAAINTAYSGIIDAKPKDCLIDFLTNPYYGAGFPSQSIGDLTAWDNYCQASGIFVSPLLTTAQSASQFLQDLMEITNSELVWNGSKLTVVPYGDQPVSGYGASYTPPSQALYSLGDDDLMPNQGVTNASSSSTENADPVECTRKSVNSSYNIIKVEFLERSNNYNPQVVDAKDDADIALTGERPADVKQFHHICLRSVAAIVAQNLLAREQYRNEIVITVGPEFMLLDPMDIIEINSEALGMTNQWVRIKEITSNSDGSFVLNCEEYLFGTGSAPVYGTEAGSGYYPNIDADPGNTSAPVLINAPVSLTNGDLEIWMAVSGASSMWGGCDVYISLDNTTYDYKDTVIGGSRYGTTLTSLGNNSDPDTSSSFNVDLGASRGTIEAATQAQADAFATLAMIDNEVIAYRDVSVISSYQFTVGPYLRRGLFGTPTASHSSGASFVRLDDTIVRIPYNKGQLGKTIYVKLPAFNIYGGGKQDLSSVTAYPVTLGPVATLPDQVTGLALAHAFTGNSLDLTWNISARADSYTVNIYKSDGTTLVRSVSVTGTAYSYPASQAALDGVQRSYKVSVTAVNSYGSASPSAQLSVSNSAPPALSGVTSGSIGTGTATISSSASSDSDLAGYIVFFSTTSGFNPSTQGSVASAAGPSITLFGLDAATYYYRMAAYDGWTSNPAFLNLSSEQSFTITTGGGSTPTGGGGSGGGYGGRYTNVSY